MKFRPTFFLTFLLLLCSSSFAQFDPSPALPGQDPDRLNRPKTMVDQMTKMRIDPEKKEFKEMLNRGEQALAISEQLEKKWETAPQVTLDDQAKLETLEKLVRSIRGELGGKDDEELAEDKDDAVQGKGQKKDSLSIMDAFRSLKSQTVNLVTELRKTTRFSISAAAIRTSNVVIRLTRFLRLRR